MENQIIMKAPFNIQGTVIGPHNHILSQQDDTAKHKHILIHLLHRKLKDKEGMDKIHRNLTIDHTSLFTY